jgi:hypothetical protein
LIRQSDTSKLMSYKLLLNELILKYLIDISNDFRLMSYFIEVIYVIIYFNPTVNFVKRLSDKKLSKNLIFSSLTHLCHYISPSLISFLVQSFLFFFFSSACHRFMPSELFILKNRPIKDIRHWWIYLKHFRIHTRAYYHRITCVVF